MSQTYHKSTKQIIDENINRTLNIIFTQFISPDIFNMIKMPLDKIDYNPNLSLDSKISQKKLQEKIIVKKPSCVNMKLNRYEIKKGTLDSINKNLLTNASIMNFQKSVKGLNYVSVQNSFNKSYASLDHSTISTRGSSANNKGILNAPNAFQKKSCLFNDPSQMTSRIKQMPINLHEVANIGRLTAKNSPSHFPSKIQGTKNNLKLDYFKDFKDYTGRFKSKKVKNILASSLTEC
ncbi:MAG: hypothetical protein MJ252_23015 [archaeon]|nr:hypothetical protein [archaeon]